MAEYIERDALVAEYDRVHVGPPGGARKLIEEAPAADVVPVVRCKDCKHRGDHEVCPLHDIRLCFDGDGHMDEVEDDKTEDEFFCAYGERKEAEC